MSVEPSKQRVHLSFPHWKQRMVEYFLQEAVEAERTGISVSVWNDQLSVYSLGL